MCLWISQILKISSQNDGGLEQLDIQTFFKLLFSIEAEVVFAKSETA